MACRELAWRLGGAALLGQWQEGPEAWPHLMQALREGQKLPAKKATTLRFEWPALDRPLPAARTALQLRLAA